MMKIVKKPVSDPATDSDPFASMGLINSWLLSAFLIWTVKIGELELFTIGI